MTSIRRAAHLQRASAAVAISCAAFFSAGCTTTVGGDTGDQSNVGGSGNSSNGGSAGTTSGSGGTPPGGGAAGTTGGTSTGGTGAGGTGGSGPMSTGGPKLRLLTKSEYLASVNSLFGNVTTQLTVPPDTSIGGLVALAASKVTVNPTAADTYETTSRAIVAEVFGDMARWQALVGCQPQANLSDACVETFARTFGKRAFRRDLTAMEVEQWVLLARNAAMVAGNAAQGLSAMVSGFLQSPYFLYRMETNALDAATDRLKYDGPSMAVRLAYFLAGGPPSAELLAAGESGQLDTPDGVRTAATPMLNDPGLVTRLTSFFYEYAQAELVMVVEKSPTLYPGFTDSLRSSMREGTRLFLEKVVLAPGADMRSFFDSNQTFADAALAPIYGVTAPASGFAQVTFPPQSGRAGIMGQAGILAAHSKPDHSSPTARGLFMMQAFLCITPEPPPGGVSTELVIDPTLTTRQKLELHRESDLCAGCHSIFDPLGMALEHYDSIGRYRETEDGLPIDTTGTLEDGTPFDGAAGLGTALRGNAQVNECLLRHFYRHVNGRDDDLFDKPQIDAMMASVTSRNGVFRDVVADFVTSEGFRSAPRVPITE
ncbi:MAG TPA: DUF1588 domain-containing protein [Polyangiaceae bacterium]